MTMNKVWGAFWTRYRILLSHSTQVRFLLMLPLRLKNIVLSATSCLQSGYYFPYDTRVEPKPPSPRHAIHAATATAGAGRMSSEATFVSSTNIRCAAYEKSGGSRMGPHGGSSSSTPPRGAKQSRVNAAKS